jgi:DNA-binding NtrC family response regulator
MSVLSPEREISAEMLQRYIPTDPESTQLAVIQKDGNHSYESERELLYKILYELRGNVTDLRRELNSVRKQMEEVRDLNGAAGFTAGTIAAVSNDNMPASIATSNDSQHRADNVEDAIAEEISEPESLNLNDVQRTMLEKALERNNGNRKKAAKELGISDRTLYRKLRQYSDDK